MGVGHVLIKRILGEKELSGKCRMYSQVTLEPGCSLGYHIHHNESETYYILKGEGVYNDNGTSCPVKAGDITFTPDGKGHGLENTGDTDLVSMASMVSGLIQKKTDRVCGCITAEARWCGPPLWMRVLLLQTF